MHSALLRPAGGERHNPSMPATSSSTDLMHMRRALTLAESALYLTSPNPRVGCVLVGSDGQVLGEGHTQAVGQAHAEVMALRDAAARGSKLKGATAYVTLEPCSHHGRTPPCCDALIEAGVSRVCVALEDPFPKVAGQGIARLRAAGIVVEVGLLAAEASELNIGFLHRIRTGRPWVRLKTAASLDGITALPNGQSQWITSEQARNDGHHWRARSCAICTGVGTVLEDNPLLDVRAVNTPRQPPLLVIDSRLQTPIGAKLFLPQRPVWIAHAQSFLPHESHPCAPHALALQAKGAQLIAHPNSAGKVSLPDLLDELGQRQINELHLEAGRLLNTSFLREGLVDELLVYLAPILLGQGSGLTALGPFDSLSQGLAWRHVEGQPIGPDLRLRLRRA